MSSLSSSDAAAASARNLRYELLGHLAGTVAHDFNNVLAAISGSAGLIEMDPAGPHTARHLDNIRRSVQRGAGVLRQLQYFHPRADGPLEPLSLTAALPALTQVFREQFGALYSIEVIMRDPLPAIRADSSQFHQILLSLATNARDAMPQGGTIEIVATIARDASAFVEISVRDYGTGIPPEVQPRLFEPFFTTKPKGRGTGLGLAIVHRLMERHGGSVRYVTEAGDGTTFTCRFAAASG